MYDDTKDIIQRCTPCQKHESINIRDAMSLTTNLQLELFDVWGIDYMGPFPKSWQCEYILVAVDYVSKWVEALQYRAAVRKMDPRPIYFGFWCLMINTTKLD